VCSMTIQAINIHSVFGIRLSLAVGQMAYLDGVVYYHQRTCRASACGCRDDILCMSGVTIQAAQLDFNFLVGVCGNACGMAYGNLFIIHNHGRRRAAAHWDWINIIRVRQVFLQVGIIDRDFLVWICRVAGCMTGIYRGTERAGCQKGHGKNDRKSNHSANYFVVLFHLEDPG